MHGAATSIQEQQKSKEGFRGQLGVSCVDPLWLTIIRKSHAQECLTEVLTVLGTPSVAESHSLVAAVLSTTAVLMLLAFATASELPRR